jgi:hypothetical protein
LLSCRARWEALFSNLLERPAVADKLGPDAFLQALESLAVGTNVASVMDSSARVKSLKFFQDGFYVLLDLPVAEALPVGLKVGALFMLAEMGHSTLMACRHNTANWVEVLTAQEAMRLTHLALQNSHFEEFSLLTDFCPAASELSPEDVLQLALQLMWVWREKDDWGSLQSVQLSPHTTAQQAYEVAFDSMLSLPMVQMWGPEDVDQLTAVALQKGKPNIQHSDSRLGVCKPVRSLDMWTQEGCCGLTCMCTLMFWTAAP